MLLSNIIKHKSDGIDELVGRASNPANAMVVLGKTLAESSLNVSEHADDQAQYTEEAAAAMEEMNSSIKEIAESAAQTTTVAEHMAESMLKAAGVAIDDLAGHSFVGSHDSVANSVLNKDADASGLMLSVAENYVGKGLKIIGTSDEIPQFPICASPGLSRSDKKKIVEALVNLKDERILKALGKKITGFALIKDSDYNGVCTMLRNLKN